MSSLLQLLALHLALQVMTAYRVLANQLDSAPDAYQDDWGFHLSNGRRPVPVRVDFDYSI